MTVPAGSRAKILFPLNQPQQISIEKMGDIIDQGQIKNLQTRHFELGTGEYFISVL
jgi:hypothetical protein